MILDTSFIIDVLRKNAYAVELLKNIQEISILKISAITVFELNTYLGKKNLANIFSNLQILPVTEEVAALGGTISKNLISKGKQIDNEDCLIAATALIENEHMLTLNTKHFKRIKNLRLLEV